MGLDMYAYAIQKDSNEYLAKDIIAEWRKHHMLYSWMHKLYISKNPDDRDTDFNLVPVVVELADLDALETVVKSNCRPMPSGAYVGYAKNHYLPEDIAFIQKARWALLSGLKVVFMCDY